MTAAEPERSQAWVFGHRLLAREAYTLQRRFLLSLRKVTSSSVLAKLWAEASSGLEAGTRKLPSEVSVVRVERLGALDLVVVQLPPPVGSGSRFIGIVFSEFEGRYVDEVENGTAVYAWLTSAEGASLRFIGAAGFVPARPGTSRAIAPGGSLGFFDDPSLESFVRAVKARHARASDVAGLVARVGAFFARRGAPSSQSGPVEPSLEAHWRRELVLLSLLVMGVTAFFGVPAVLAGIDGRFPTAVTCTQLSDRRVRSEHDGKYVLLSGCEFSFEDLRGSVNVFNHGVTRLELPLYVPNRTKRSEPVVYAVIRRHDLVSPFSFANAWGADAMRNPSVRERGPDSAMLEAVSDAQRSLGAELDSGLGGVISSKDLLHGPPPGLGLGFILVFLVGAAFALLARFAPRRHLTWVFALMEQRSRREAGARG